MSVNLDGLVPVRTLRFGGQVDWDDPIQIPNGLALVCQNMQFLAESVKVRWGMRFAMQAFGLMANATGVDVLTVLGAPQAPTIRQQAGGASVAAATLTPNALVGNLVGFYQPILPNTQVALVFGDNGALYMELPAGSGNLVAGTGRISTALAALLPTSSGMQTAKAYNRIYQAYAEFMDLASPASTGPVLALDAATGCVSPVGQNPIAAAWLPNTFYQMGDIVTPVANPNTWFRRLADGYSGASEPSWPTTLGYFTPTYDATYAQAEDAGGLGLSTTTLAPITVTGTQFVPVDSITGLTVGQQVLIDTGGSQETVTILAIGLAFRFGHFYSPPSIEANFTKTHLSGVTVTPIESLLWQEWTPGFPSYLPTPSPIATLTQTPGGGTIAINLDVYVCLTYFNALGESLWTAPVFFAQTQANDKLTGTFGTANPLSGPPMPSWLMSVMERGTSGVLHWPLSNCVGIYVASVAHGSAAPTEYRLYGTTSADRPIVISSIPTSGTQFTVRTAFAAPITTQQFMGEGGTRYAILLRQNTMGDLSPVDPRAALPVQFLGGVSEAASINGVFSGGGIYTWFIQVADVTQFIQGQTVSLTNWTQPNVNGTYVITGVGLYSASNVFPGGYINVTTTNTATFQATGNVGVASGPCPVAVVPPGTQETPGYSYDILAFTVAGLGDDGPFNYLTDPEPANPFSSIILNESTDGNGNAYAQLESAAGLAAGDSVFISGYTGAVVSYNGLRVLASVVGNAVTFPDPSGAGGSAGALMTLVQTEPTQAVAPAGINPVSTILLQFDDTTLPEGVDVTGNLLFVALPPCTDLAFLPSVSRMAYVSDQFPTSLIFSEEDFNGEVDGENDVLSIEASNGALLVGARELLNGMIVAAKCSGGYQVVPTADVPARWGVNRLWGIHGPRSGRNIATGRDGSTGLDYFLFVDPEAGLFKWPPTLLEGELDWLSKELSGANNQDASRMATWDRVNRAAGATIQVVVDDIAKEVKIAVPLDGAATPSHILTMSYFNGWQPPLMMTLQGDWVPSRQARRWNIDPIATNCMAMVERTLATPVDQRVNYHQLLLGVPTVLAPSSATIVAAGASVAIQPSIPNGTYYAQLARVTNGETSYSPVMGPFTVATIGAQISTSEDGLATGFAVINVANPAAFSVGQTVIVDTGVNQETVVITSFVGVSPVAFFTKTHNPNVPIFSTSTGPFSFTGFQAVLPADQLESSWTIYFGASAAALTSQITGVPNNVATFLVLAAGAPTTTPTGFIGMQFMEPGVYDDLGGGYNARYRPAYAKEAPNQAWPDGERVLRFSAVTGRALGAGFLNISPVSEDPNYSVNPKLVSLDVGVAEVPGSAPITKIREGLKADGNYLTCEFSNGGVPGAWFQLCQISLWHKPLWP
jgi:hypothetical protein